MFFRRKYVLSWVLLSILTTSALGDQLHYYQVNGVTYCETRRTVQRPVIETTMQPSMRTVYKQQCYTETKDVAKVYYTPVTTYRPDTHWVGILNPFVEPALETDWIPETYWQQRTEVVKMPVTCRKLVPEMQQVQVPVTTQKIVSEEYVVNRVAIASPVEQTVPQTIPQPYQQPYQMQNPLYVSRPPLPASAPVYGYGQIGGIARLNQDPPRYGTSINSGTTLMR